MTPLWRLSIIRLEVFYAASAVWLLLSGRDEDESASFSAELQSSQNASLKRVPKFRKLILAEQHPPFWEKLINLWAANFHRSILCE